VPAGEKVVLVAEFLPDTQAQLAQAHRAGVVPKPESADLVEAVLGAVNAEAVQVPPLQPNTVCTIACNSAIVVCAGTSSRRQIRGLIPPITARSW
jgi:hypothetical protein